jgi:hypothetical protein
MSSGNGVSKDNGQVRNGGEGGNRWGRCQASRFSTRSEMMVFPRQGKSCSALIRHICKRLHSSRHSIRNSQLATRSFPLSASLLLYCLLFLARRPCIGGIAHSIAYTIRLEVSALPRESGPWRVCCPLPHIATWSAGTGTRSHASKGAWHALSLAAERTHARTRRLLSLATHLCIARRGNMAGGHSTTILGGGDIDPIRVDPNKCV